MRAHTSAYQNNQSKTVWARWSRSNSKWTWFDCSEKTIKLWINQTAESEPNKPVCFWLQEAFLLDTSCYTEPWGANWAKGQNCSFPEMPYVLDMWTDKQNKTSFFYIYIYNCRLIQWATALCSLCLGNFSWFLPAIRKGLFFHWRNSDQWIKDFYKIIFSHTKPNGKQAKYHYLSDSDSVNGPIHMKAH